MYLQKHADLTPSSIKTVMPLYLQTNITSAFTMTWDIASGK
jgi:cation transport regulator ChaB